MLHSTLCLLSRHTTWASGAYQLSCIQIAALNCLVRNVNEAHLVKQELPGKSGVTH